MMTPKVPDVLYVAVLWRLFPDIVHLYADTIREIGFEVENASLIKEEFKVYKWNTTLGNVPEAFEEVEWD